MNKFLWALLVISALLFLVVGLRWLLEPAAIAADLGMPLLDEVGRSTQIGDMSALFLALGIFILMALTSGERLWYYPPMMLLGLAAFSRIVAWLFHGAPIFLEAIILELLSSGLLFLGTFWLSEPNQ